MLLLSSPVNLQNTFNYRYQKGQKFLFLFLSLSLFILFSDSGYAEEILINENHKISEESEDKQTKSIQNKKKKPIEIYSDFLETIEGKDIIIFKGHVDIYYKEIHIKADKVQINSKTGKGIASGRVLIEDKKNKVTGDKTFFDINSKNGVIYNAEGSAVSEYYFSGQKIKKVGDDRFKIYKGTLTTCFGNKPTWLFKCDYADLTIEKYAFMKNPSFWVKGIPLFYLPYGFIPVKTKRATGFLFPFIGSSSRDGFFINNNFFWAINDRMDATISIDYMENKGVRPSLEFRYTPTQKIAGQFNGTYLEEIDTGREFWKIGFNHKQELNYGIRMVAKADMLSNNNYDKEYGDITENRTRRFSDSYITLSKNWESRSLEVLARYRNSIEFSREEEFGLLPQVTFRNQSEKIFNTPLYFNMESSFTGFEREINSQETKIQRFDLHPQLSLPFTALPWMTFTPAIGFRETYYNIGNDGSGNSIEGFTRELYDITSTLEGPKFSRVFDNAVFSEIKHIIEPRIIHKYIPDIDVGDRSKIIVFDGIDNVVPQNIVQYTLTNRFLQKKLNEDSYTTDEILRFEINQSYDFREATKTLSSGVERRPFSDVRWDIDSHIWDPIRLNFDGTYDVYDSLIKTANMELGFSWLNFWSIYFERRYIKDKSTFIIGSLGLNLKKGWGAKYSVRFDELNSEFQENDISLKYTALCWDIALDFVNRNNYINGQKQTENKFFFLITLKGIGSVGQKRNATILHRGL